MEDTTQNLAANYAASVAQGIRADVANGTPFGIVDADHYADDKADGDALDAWDYMPDVLEIEYLVTSGGEFRAARLLITFGGPNAVIDTRTGDLEVAWGSDRATEHLPEAFTSALDDACAEFWAASR